MKGKEYWFEVDFFPYAELLSQIDSIYIYPGNLEISTLYYFPRGKIDSLNLTRLSSNGHSRATMFIKLQ